MVLSKTFTNNFKIKAFSDMTLLCEVWWGCRYQFWRKIVDHWVSFPKLVAPPTWMRVQYTRVKYISQPSHDPKLQPLCVYINKNIILFPLVLHIHELKFSINLLKKRDSTWFLYIYVSKWLIFRSNIQKLFKCFPTVSVYLKQVNKNKDGEHNNSEPFSIKLLPCSIDG